MNIQTLTLSGHEPTKGKWGDFEDELMKVMYADKRIEKERHFNKDVRHIFFNKTSHDNRDQILHCVFYDEVISNNDPKKFNVKLPNHGGTYTYIADEGNSLLTAFKACVLETYNEQHRDAQKKDVRFINNEFYFIAVQRHVRPRDNEAVTKILHTTLQQGLRFMIKI